jgi:DNA-binding transcriptional MerR regulator
MELWTTRSVAKFLDITETAVRYHERQGHIFAIKVERGGGEYQRLFFPQDIERFKLQRDEVRSRKRQQEQDAELVGTAREAPDTP